MTSRQMRGVVVTVVAHRRRLPRLRLRRRELPVGLLRLHEPGCQTVVDGSGTVLTQVAAGLPSTGVREHDDHPHFMQAGGCVDARAWTTSCRLRGDAVDDPGREKAAAMLVETIFPSVTASVPALTVRSSPQRSMDRHADRDRA